MASHSQVAPLEGAAVLVEFQPNPNLGNVVAHVEIVDLEVESVDFVEVVEIVGLVEIHEVEIQGAHNLIVAEIRILQQPGVDKAHHSWEPRISDPLDDALVHLALLVRLVPLAHHAESVRPVLSVHQNPLDHPGSSDHQALLVHRSPLDHLDPSVHQDPLDHLGP